MTLSASPNPFASINRRPCPECGGPMTRGAPRCGKCRDDRNEEAMRSAKVHTAGRRVATWLTVADFDRLKGKADAAKVPIYLFIQQVLADAP